MHHKYGKRPREFLGRFYYYFSLVYWGVFNKTIISLSLVGYEVIIANSVLLVSLAIYHFISKARSCNIV